MPPSFYASPRWIRLKEHRLETALLPNSSRIYE